MKRGMFSFVIGAGLFMAAPFMVHAEDGQQEAKEERGSLIGGTLQTLGNTVKNVGEQAGESTGAILEETVNSVGKTVEDAVDFTAGTVEELANPVDSTLITSTLKDTGSLVEKAVANTTPVVNTTVKEATDTVTGTTAEVFDAVDQTVENLPAVPVVTPVVKEVNNTVQKVTSGVQETLENTTDAVTDTVEAVTETTEKAVEETVDVVDRVAGVPGEAEEVTPVEPERPATELPAAEVVAQPAVPATQPQAPAETDVPMQPEPPRETDVPVVSQPPVERVVEDEAALLEETVAVPAAHPIIERDFEQPAAVLIGSDEAPVASASQLPFAQSGADTTEATNDTAPVSPAPILPEEQNGSRAMATVPAQSGAPSSGQASVAGPGADLGYGTLVSSDMFKSSTGKLWYHKNSYAIIQWIHTPLRKPPEATPFLHVA